LTIGTYKRKFATRPVQIDPSAPPLGGIHDPDGLGLDELVKKGELGGCAMWRENSSGGVWFEAGA
jgi:hypothetical protein